MADESQNLGFGERPTSFFPLGGHGPTVIGPWIVSPAFAIRIAVGGDSGCLIGLGSGIHPIQHVFNMRESLHRLTVFQDSTSTTGTVGTVATSAGTVVLHAESNRTLCLGFLRLQATDVHEQENRHQSEGGHSPGWYATTGFGGRDIGRIGLLCGLLGLSLH